MRRFGYPQGFSAGVIAAGGTLGIMLPPSTVLAVYGILTQQDIGKLFMAGIIPGLLAMLMYVLTIMIIVKVRPDWLPRGEAKPWPSGSADLKNVWAPLVLFLFVVGGSTAASSRGGSRRRRRQRRLHLGVVRGKLDRAKIKAALLSATRTCAAVFTVLIGALLFGYFLTITQTPQKLTEFLTAWASAATACWR
jgi:C4-dicarboxylate transporter DctM subunit